MPVESPPGSDSPQREGSWRTVSEMSARDTVRDLCVTRWSEPSRLALVSEISGTRTSIASRLTR